MGFASLPGPPHGLTEICFVPPARPTAARSLGWLLALTPGDMALPLLGSPDRPGEVALLAGGGAKARGGACVPILLLNKWWDWLILGVDPTIYVHWRGMKAPFGRRCARTGGDTPARWRVAPSLITLTNDYANYMIKLMTITNIS
jgi:hypothetical protein